MTRSSLVAMAVGLLLCSRIGVSQTALRESLVCRVPLSIGEVPGVPFVAQIVNATRKYSRDTTKTLLLPQVRSEGLPSVPLRGEEVSSVLQEHGTVARDSKGRVMVKLFISRKRRDGEGSWYEYLCDPATKTTISLYSSSGPQMGRVQMDSQYNPRTHQPKYSTTASFQDWHLRVPGREEIGHELFEELPAVRYRIPHNGSDKTYSDVVNSDELFVELAEIDWNPYPTLAEDWRLTDIRLTEPSKSLFTRPPWAVRDTIPPSTVPPQMLGPDPCRPPACPL